MLRQCRSRSFQAGRCVSQDAQRHAKATLLRQEAAEDKPVGSVAAFYYAVCCVGIALRLFPDEPWDEDKTKVKLTKSS